MLSIPVITFHSQRKERNIYISPFLLQSTEVPDLKSGPISKLYLYDEQKDDEYKAGLKQADISLGPRFDKHVINFGQDFWGYYLGSLSVNFENKKYLNWQCVSGKFPEQDFIRFTELLFDPLSHHCVTIMTPTQPSDINFGRI